MAHAVWYGRTGLWLLDARELAGFIHLRARREPNSREMPEMLWQHCAEGPASCGSTTISAIRPGIVSPAPWVEPHQRSYRRGETPTGAGVEEL